MSSKPLTRGQEMEMRVARLWFWEGYYARCGINLKHHYHPETLLVTDLDLLAYEFGPSLNCYHTIGEVKTGTGRSATKPLDRIIWLRGLKELVGSDQAVLVSRIAPSIRARDLASSIGVEAQSVQDIERREELLDIASVEDVGWHGSRAFVERMGVHEHCGTDPSLERAYWFLRSEVWFLDDITATKRLIGLYRQLAAIWNPDIDDLDSRALRWLIAETVSIFVLNCVRVTARALRSDQDKLKSTVAELLSAGLASAHALRQISADVDKYVAGLLSQSNASAVVRAEAMGALQPAAPEWTEPFIELIVRLAASLVHARALPRQIDVVMHDRVVWRRHVTDVPRDRLALDDPESSRLMRLFAAFLRSQVSEIQLVDRALSTPLGGQIEPGSLSGRSGASDGRDHGQTQPPLLEM